MWDHWYFCFGFQVKFALNLNSHACFSTPTISFSYSPARVIPAKLCAGRTNQTLLETPSVLDLLCSGSIFLLCTIFMETLPNKQLFYFLILKVVLHQKLNTILTRYLTRRYWWFLIRILWKLSFHVFMEIRLVGFTFPKLNLFKVFAIQQNLAQFLFQYWILFEIRSVNIILHYTSGVATYKRASLI